MYRFATQSWLKSVKPTLWPRLLLSFSTKTSYSWLLGTEQWLFGTSVVSLSRPLRTTFCGILTATQTIYILQVTKILLSHIARQILMIWCQKESVKFLIFDQLVLYRTWNFFVEYCILLFYLDKQAAKWTYQLLNCWMYFSLVASQTLMDWSTSSYKCRCCPWFP